jgi:hypothetical protein
MIEPFPAYRRLLDTFRFIGVAQGDSGLVVPVGPLYFADLVTWYHLAWTGETSAGSTRSSSQLMTKGGTSTHRRSAGPARRDRRDASAALMPRWRALAAAGQHRGVEQRRYTHPIAPLMLDFGCARNRCPTRRCPASRATPADANAAAAHRLGGLESHAAASVTPPAGLWPAEGAVSGPFVDMLGRDAGLRWTASSEAVLAASLTG